MPPLLSARNAFSTRWCCWCKCLSYSHRALLFFRSRIPLACPEISFAQRWYRYVALAGDQVLCRDAGNESMSLVQSARVASEAMIPAGIPCASPARCILVLSPPLRSSFLDCLHALRQHADADADAPCNGLHQSSATQNRSHQALVRTVPSRHPVAPTTKSALHVFQHRYGMIKLNILYTNLFS